MGRYHVILFLLCLLIMVSNGQEDWLGGGYVVRGDNSEVGQYYMDPIFYFTGDYHYVSPDPAIRQMQDFLDYGNGYYMFSDPAIRQMQGSLDWPRHFVDGHWQLWLSDGTSLDLTLSQSGNEVFGYGLMTFGRENQRVTASGSIYGRNLELKIALGGGINSYTISIDVGYSPLSGTYTAYRAGAYPKSGYVNAYRLAK